MNLSAHLARYGHGPLDRHQSINERLDSITLHADSTAAEVRKAVEALTDYFRISCGCSSRAAARRYARYSVRDIVGSLRCSAGLPFDYNTVSALVGG